MRKEQRLPSDISTTTTPEIITKENTATQWHGNQDIARKGMENSKNMNL